MRRLCPLIFALFISTIAVCTALELPQSKTDSKIRRFYGHQVYRVEANTEKKFQELVRLQNEVYSFDFWTDPKFNGFTDIRVAPENYNLFKNLMEIYEIPYTVLIQDVEQLVEQERVDNERAKKQSKAADDLQHYCKHDEIQEYMTQLARDYSNLMTLETIGWSSEGREMKTAKISSGPGSAGKKQVIAMDCGIHAREWIAPPFCIHTMSQLTKNASQNEDLLSLYDFMIVPTVNPDGYEYTHSNDRMWRKTRSKNSGSTCIGTDPNRNFEYHWGEVGASSNPCSETYMGTSAFSEPETQAIRNMIKSLEGNCAYYTFHSYGLYWLYPWGWTSTEPADNQTLRDVGQKAADALRTYAGTIYTVGSSTNVLYAAAGGSDDWAKAEGHCEISYTVELRDKDRYGFLLPPEQIRPTCEETWIGFRTALLEMPKYAP